MSDIDYDDELDDGECWNCGGEGRVNHCIDGFCAEQDDPYCKYCSKRCDVCSPARAPHPPPVEGGENGFHRISQPSETIIGQDTPEDDAP